MMKKRKILIFGGSFSPPTIAHEAITAACLSLPQFAEVWLMPSPSGDRLDKRIAMPDDHRMHMLKLLKAERFGGDPRLHIADFELRLPRPTQTYKTARALAGRYKDAEFWFVFGADSYASMHQWPHGTPLRQHLKMIIFAGNTTKPITAGNVVTIKIGDEYADVSSTKARQALAAGRRLDGLVSEPIARYLASI